MDVVTPRFSLPRSARSSGSRSSWRPPLVLLVLFVVSLPAVTPRIYASDEAQYFAFLRSLWFDHDLSFDNEYRHFYDAGATRNQLFRETFLEMTTETGRRINFGTIGCAILWSPFYAVADVAARLLHGAGAPIAVDGYAFPYVAAVCYGSATYAWLAVWLSFLVARRVVPAARSRESPWALSPALFVLMGTPLLFYTYISPPMAHACSAFAVSAFVLAWLHVRARWSPRGMAALGALAALMTMVREQDVFFVVGPALDYAWTLYSSAKAGPIPEDGESSSARGGLRRFSPRSMALSAWAGTSMFALVFVPQAVAYLVLNGHIGPSRLVSRKMTWTSPHALQVLFSPEHGLFLWTPIAAIALVGLVGQVWRPWIGFTGGHEEPDFAGAARGNGAGDPRRLAVCLLAMVLSQVYVAGCVESWTVAGAFGQRRFVGLTPMLVAGLTWLAGAVRRRASRVALAILLALAIWWNLGLMVQFGSGMMDRQRLDLARAARNTFITVPMRLPELARRYLFNRSSFYQPRAAADR